MASGVGVSHLAITRAADLVDQGIRMGMRIPFSDKGHQAISQMSEIGEVTDLKPLALQDAEPLLNLVHKGSNGLAESGRQSGDGAPASVEPACHDGHSNYRAQERRV